MYYLETWKECFGILFKTFKNLYRANETRYIDSEGNLSSHCFNFKRHNCFLLLQTNYFNNLFFQSPENNLFCLFDCLFVCLENLAVQPNSENLAVQPNSEKPGSPNPPNNKKLTARKMTSHLKKAKLYYFYAHRCSI